MVFGLVLGCRALSGVIQVTGVVWVRREWEPEELISSWTLLDEDWRLVGNKTSATRLGFSVLLKFF